MKPSRTLVVLLAAAVFVASGAAAMAVADDSHLIMGERKGLGDGSVVSWVRASDDGTPLSIGVSFDDGALQNLGTDDKEIVLAIPSTPGSFAKNLVIDWNPHGHPPPHVYDVPHFDFHVYSIDEGARMAIAPEAPLAAAKPAPDIVPDGLRAGGTIPMMGQHYVPVGQPEFHGGVFTQVPIVGYWGGHLAFIESMIALSYLQTHPSFSAPYPQPAHVEGSSWYPTTYGVAYDAVGHRYDVTFSKTNLR